MYRVYQDGIRCKEYNVQGWEVDTFDTKDEAELFAYMWAYPFDLETAKVNKKEMQLSVEYDMSMSESKVMMKIEEV